MQITARIGLADTKRAAMALARFGRARINRADAGQTRPALAKLPIAALGLARDTQNDLHRTGLKTLGQLYEFKSSELARRFGLELPQHLAKALGHHPDPVCPIEADPVFAAAYEPAHAHRIKIRCGSGAGAIDPLRVRTFET